MAAQRVTSPESRLVVRTVRRRTQLEPFQRDRRSSTECAPAGCLGESVPETVNRAPAATLFCTRGALSVGLGSGVGLHQCAGCGVETGATGKPLTSQAVGTGVTARPVQRPRPSLMWPQIVYGYELPRVQPLYAHTAKNQFS